jgi:citrate lyase synthetase
MSNKRSPRSGKPVRAITGRVMRVSLDAAYHEGLAVIAVAAFRRAFKDTLQYAARITPENSLNAVTADYLRAMRAQLEQATSHSATLTERWS